MDRLLGRAALAVDGDRRDADRQPAGEDRVAADMEALLADLADAQTEASHAIGSYVEYLETEMAPRARASFRLGRERFEQKVRLEEGLSMSADRLLAIAMRGLERFSGATPAARNGRSSQHNGDDADHDSTRQPIPDWQRLRQF